MDNLGAFFLGKGFIVIGVIIFALVCWAWVKKDERHKDT